VTRSITIYQTWHSEDMANTDLWWPSLRQARNYLSQNYGVQKAAIKLVDGDWGMDLPEGHAVYCSAHVVTMNAEGVCSALTFCPNR